MSRFFIKEEQICGDLIRIEGADAHHIARVLRMKEGEELLLCDFFNTEYRTVIRALSGDFVEAEIVEKRAGASEMPFPVVLYMALPKGDKMEWIIQKAVETGVTEIVPVEMARSIAKIDKSNDRKQQRWQRIAAEAAGQSGRGILPTVSSPLTFAEAAKRMANERTLVFYEGGGKPVSALVGAADEAVSIVIGPEGGFAPEEVALLCQNGAETATLGPRILRCETAPIAALTLIMGFTGNMD